MIATTIEQSNKLLKLGLDKRTSDMYWDKDNMDSSTLHIGKPYSKACIPAWSLSALMELWPKNDYLILDVGYWNYDLNGHTLGKWTSSYLSVKHGDMGEHEESGDTSVEAAFKLTCWLLQNNLINKEEKQ